MPTFTVTVPPENETLYPNPQGEAAGTFTVQNSTNKPARTRVRLAGVPPALDPTSVLSVDGREERDILGNEAESFSIKLACVGAPAGRYGFKLVAENAADPNRDYTESKIVTFDWAPPKPIKKRIPRWLIPAIAAAVVVAIAVTAVLVLARPHQVAMPEIKGKSLTEAKALLAKAGLTADQDIDVGEPPAGVNVIVQGQEPEKGEMVDSRQKVKMHLLRPVVLVTGGSLDLTSMIMGDQTGTAPDLRYNFNPRGMPVLSAAENAVLSRIPVQGFDSPGSAMFNALSGPLLMQAADMTVLIGSDLRLPADGVISVDNTEGALCVARYGNDGRLIEKPLTEVTEPSLVYNANPLCVVPLERGAVGVVLDYKQSNLRFVSLTYDAGSGHWRQGRPILLRLLGAERIRVCPVENGFVTLSMDQHNGAGVGVGPANRVSRFTTSGLADPNFNNGKPVVVSTSTGDFTHMSVAPTGRIYLAGRDSNTGTVHMVSVTPQGAVAPPLPVVPIDGELTAIVAPGDDRILLCAQTAKSPKLTERKGNGELKQWTVPPLVSSATQPDESRFSLVLSAVARPDGGTVVAFQVQSSFKPAPGETRRTGTSGVALVSYDSSGNVAGAVQRLGTPLIGASMVVLNGGGLAVASSEIMGTTLVRVNASTAIDPTYTKPYSFAEVIRGAADANLSLRAMIPLLPVGSWIYVKSNGGGYALLRVDKVPTVQKLDADLNINFSCLVWTRADSAAPNPH